MLLEVLLESDGVVLLFGLAVTAATTFGGLVTLSGGSGRSITLCGGGIGGTPGIGGGSGRSTPSVVGCGLGGSIGSASGFSLQLIAALVTSPALVDLLVGVAEPIFSVGR